MDKIQYREIQRAWLRFDRATAFGCKARGNDFNVAYCKEMWFAYLGVLEMYGIKPPPLPSGF
jgi:hypothetical protein